MAGNAYKTVDEGGAGLPAPRASRGRLLALCYGVVICTAIALTADGPLLPTMVTQLGGVSPTEAGAWIGLIQGSYYLAQIFVAPVMGYLSDVFGRKPIMLYGCVAMACGTFAFGFSSSVPMMIAIRFLTGLCNNNLAVTKSYLADLSVGMEPAKRALLFNYISACFSGSRALTAGLAGMSVGIPFPGTDLLAAAPMALASVPIFAIAAVVHFCMPAADGIRKGAASGRAAATTSLRMKVREHAARFGAGLSEIRADGLLRTLMWLYTANSFSNGAAFVGIIIILGLDTVHGGFGYKPKDAANAIILFGAISVLFQVLLFGKLVRTLGSRGVYIWVGCPAIGVGTLLLPMAGVLKSNLLLLVGLAASGLGIIALIPSNVAMTAASTPAGKHGITQGTFQGIGSFARGAGPIGFGFLSASRAIWLPFVLISATYWVAMLVALQRVPVDVCAPDRPGPGAASAGEDEDGIALVGPRRRRSMDDADASDEV